MTFSQIEYKRVDTETLKAQLAELLEQLKGAKTFEEAERAFLAEEELEGMTGHTDTLQLTVRGDEEGVMEVLRGIVDVSDCTATCSQDTVSMLFAMRIASTFAISEALSTT